MKAKSWFKPLRQLPSNRLTKLGTLSLRQGPEGVELLYPELLFSRIVVSSAISEMHRSSDGQARHPVASPSSSTSVGPLYVKVKSLHEYLR